MSAGYLKKCSTGNKPKQKHATQDLAEKQRSSMISAGIWKASGSNTYWCNQCGGYHAGAMGKNNRGKGRKAAKNTPRWLATQ